MNVLKTCSHCKRELSASQFGHWMSWCKECQKTIPSKTYGTLSYFKTRVWNEINARTINGSHPNWNGYGTRGYLEKGTRLEMTREEFNSWCDKNEPAILEMYLSGTRPSVDRKDPAGHYALDNIQVKTFAENSRAGQAHKAILSRTPVIATNVVTGEVLYFESMSAAENLGFQQSNIGNCARGTYGYKTHKGFRWEYADPTRRPDPKKPRPKYASHKR